MDYFLKAANEAAMRAALVDAGVVVINDAVVNEAGDVLVQAHDGVAEGFDLDVIGPISKPTGQTLTVDGVQVAEMAPVPGYHANLRGVLSDTQLAILEALLLPEPPANPYRTWADMPLAVVEVEEIPVEIVTDEALP